MAKLVSKFASASQEWSTPPSIFVPLDKEFNFVLDVCATKENTKVPMFYYTKEDDALSKDWVGHCWMNPPFNELGKWVKKASLEGARPMTWVICLLPARTNTNWWHEYVMKASEIRFVIGRPKFNDSTHGLPQPLAVVVFGRWQQEQTIVSSFRMNRGIFTEDVLDERVGRTTSNTKLSIDVRGFLG